MKKWMAMAAALALVGAAVPHGFAENVYTPGTYAAQAKGFGGVVSVSVTFDEKGMTDVQVEAPDADERDRQCGSRKTARSNS